MKDLYSALGVQRDADAQTIKKNYKKLARRYHPDVSKETNAEARFKEVGAAYGVLGDPERRKLYDEFGEVSLQSGFDAERARAYGGRGGMGGNPFAGGGVNMDDLLANLFGGGMGGGSFQDMGFHPGQFGGQRRRPRKGVDLRADIRVAFMTTVRGGETAVSLARPDGTPIRLNVKVPAGVGDGQTIRLRGQAKGAPPGGQPGDLLLTVHAQPHPRLVREGDDLLLNLPLTIREAVEGTKLEVKTPWSTLRVSIPPGADPGSRLRLKGHGIRQGKKHGDLYLVLQPTPPKGSAEELVEAAAALDEFYDEGFRVDLDE